MAVDVIDRLAGIEPGSRLDAARGVRATARAQAQASHEALFAPADFGGVAAEVRFAVAGFVAGVSSHPEVADFHLSRLADAAALRAAIAGAITRGPYGDYPPGPLAGESAPGPVWRAPAGMERKLAAALEHAHMLVFHPRDASAAHLQALLDAGWSTTDVVTLSQLVAFVSFQIRVVAGLRVLGGCP